MLKSLYWKLSLAFMLVAFTTAALVALSIRLTNENRLMQLIIDQQRSSLEQALSDYYASHGSWVGVAESWQQIQSITRPTPAATPEDRPPADNRPPGSEERGNLFGLADAQGVVIVSVDPKYPAGSILPPEMLSTGTTVSTAEVTAGTILIARQPPQFNPQEARYLKRINEALTFATIGALLVALIMGILLARTLTRPVQELTLAARNISQGQLEQQVRVRSNDEIGQLATAFNSMSQEVARVNQLRRQMTADIAHDLRTPLTVISGYVESMRDGVLSLPQSGYRSSIPKSSACRTWSGTCECCRWQTQVSWL